MFYISSTIIKICQLFFFRKIRRIRTEQNSPRNTHFGQKESERETHKLNEFLCGSGMSYVILRNYFERVMSFYVNFFMILVILRKFLRARIAYMENYL